MNKILRITILLACIPIFISANHMTDTYSSTSYDIVGIYEKTELKEGAKGLDSYGNIKDIKAVFAPAKMDIGKYEVKLTRIDTNFYNICGTSLYIETKHCNEYATRNDAILNIRSNYGYIRGETIFLKNW
ncbi:MAG: hypothetical protein J1E02_01615 [Coprobacter sp.]|nr:hypothetical protein [Coprobacter sp.]